jgi:hypothetical protein
MMHISKRSIDTTLSRYSVRSGREQLANTRSIESSFRQTDCCAKPCATSSNDKRVILVINDGHAIDSRQR